MTNTEQTHAKKLQSLLSDYYNNLITRDEYLRHRKVLLDIIDHDYNGVGIPVNADEDQVDSFSMNTTSFFRNTENEQ